MPEKWLYFPTTRKGRRNEGSSFLKVSEEQVWFTGSPAARSDLRDQQEEPSLQGAPGIRQQIRDSVPPCGRPTPPPCLALRLQVLTRACDDRLSHVLSCAMRPRTRAWLLRGVCVPTYTRKNGVGCARGTRRQGGWLSLRGSRTSRTRRDGDGVRGSRSSSRPSRGSEGHASALGC